MLHSSSGTKSPRLLTQRTSRVLWPCPHGTEHYGGTRHTTRGGSESQREGRELGADSQTVTHRRPLGADLPLAADLQLAGAGRLWPLQVLAVAGVDVERAVGVNLTAQDLAVLHAEPAGFAAF